MRVFALIAFTCAALPGWPTTADAQTADQKAVAATVRSYHDVLARGASAGAMRLLASDALSLESGGLATRADHQGHHLPGDIAFATAVPSQRAEPMVLTCTADGWRIRAIHWSSRTVRTPKSAARGKPDVTVRNNTD